MVSATNLLVFREVNEQVPGSRVVLRLREALSRIKAHHSESVLSALILAGELECALADSQSASATQAASITDALAPGVRETTSLDLASAFLLLSVVERSLPDFLRISHPEGFAYYALHPADFAEAAAASFDDGSVGVIGIRSIGTTLSAVARSALVRKGIFASRISVRPIGHPYDRKTELTSWQTAWVEQHKRKGSAFLIVDEGPGLSGSSFLSVAEALERHGIRASQIILLGTGDADPARLCAHDASARWLRYQWKRAGSLIARAYADHLPLSGGNWRGMLLAPGVEWPACWPEMESLKFFARNHQDIVKFEGLGIHNERNRQRAEVLFEAGFAPRSKLAKAGMASYEFVPGLHLTPSGLSTEVLDRIAEYCAFRARTFHAEQKAEQVSHMLRFNLLQEMRVDVEVPATCFECKTAVFADCRMHPHEWIRSSTGALLKTDGNADGEGHFLPGPTDILWDVAGAIIEWKMSAQAQEYMLGEFQRRMGKISEARLSWFLLAYSVFRLSYSKMARSSTQDFAEQPRLQEAVLYYKHTIDKLLRRCSIAYRMPA